LNNRLDYYLPRLVPTTALNGISRAALTASPAQLRTLPAPVLDGVIEAFSRSLSTVFLWAVPITLVAFAVSWLLREIPLREHAHVGTQTEQPPTPTLAAEPVERP
jgi:hypothetical protein